MTALHFHSNDSAAHCCRLDMAPAAQRAGSRRAGAYAPGQRRLALPPLNPQWYLPTSPRISPPRASLQAEALTQHLTTILCQNKEKLEEFYASKVALEKVGVRSVDGGSCSRSWGHEAGRGGVYRWPAAYSALRPALRQICKRASLCHVLTPHVSVPLGHLSRVCSPSCSRRRSTRASAQKC